MGHMMKQSAAFSEMSTPGDLNGKSCLLEMEEGKSGT